jgi:hypothetical protein
MGNIMPVFVEWEWKEQTKSFLVIFHFYDDFSRPNLRIKKYKNGRLFVVTPERPLLTPEESWMSWAPSHPELALLSQLLSYANIVNGFKESNRRELRHKLGGFAEANNVLAVKIPKELSAKSHVIYFTRPEDSEDHHHFCTQLCPEYIDYLTDLLKPYLK